MFVRRIIATSVLVPLLTTAAADDAMDTRFAYRSDIWPGARQQVEHLRTVHVYTDGHDAAKDACLAAQPEALDAFFHGNDPRLVMGERCGRLFVLVRDPSGTTWVGEARRFAAIHETYHLAAQLFGGPTPNLLVFGQRPASTPGSDRFFEKLARGSAEPSGDDADRAREILHDYQSMSPDDRRVVEFFATVEWPAEYYAFAVMASDEPDWTLQRYLAVRRRAGDEAAYRAAIPVGMLLDRSLGSTAWRPRLFKDQSMLTLLAHLASFDMPPVEMSRVSAMPLDLRRAAR